MSENVFAFPEPEPDGSRLEAWAGHQAVAALSEEEERLRARIAAGEASEADYDGYTATRRALRAHRALWRAALRCEIEGVEKPIVRVMVDCDELARDGIPFDYVYAPDIDPETGRETPHESLEYIWQVWPHWRAGEYPPMP